ncbi:T-complex-associated testis-expressed protein 1 [Selaginella moellendorffii]|uniref:T-complex-associated testis-expressed protein 1 n=1 Tax=Selaginella moellendorffii TaxID=88036 RepID=UPI000D1C52C0|nr:T-complex-associated testis-expressed protein 1 [Selaginella moellendorffii]|eukprot:XP_024530431.1 T-complex-associated testis-expressed protein 1 [Selaginella moellendorffii]
MADSSNTTTPAPSAPTPTPTTSSITTNISKPATPRSRESSESAGSDGGRPRGYIATRFFRPSLVDLCIPVMAANFLCFPTFGYISLDLRPKVVTLLPLDLPLDLAAYLIYEDEYWERRSRLHWSNSDIAAHGRSWKQLFFERYFSDALESFDPTCSEESALTNMLHICAQYIHNLIIYQLPSRLNISVFLVPLASQIETLKIEYGSRNVGMEYDKLRFGMKTSDCRSVSAALRVEILVNGMAANPTIVHLDLSHNYISDAGVIEIMRLMSADKSVLTVLNLCNNCITTQGSLPLTANSSEVQLMQRLSLSSCQLGELSVAALTRLLHNPKSGLNGVDVSSNKGIGESGGNAILAALLTDVIDASHWRCYMRAEALMLTTLPPAEKGIRMECQEAESSCAEMQPIYIVGRKEIPDGERINANVKKNMLALVL